MAVKRRNKSIYISVYSYTIPAFEPKNPVFPGIFVSKIQTLKQNAKKNSFKDIRYITDKNDTRDKFCAI